jgi:chromosome segregation ATPase
MLDQLQETLNQASAAGDQQEASLTESPSETEAPATRFDDWQRKLDEVNERLQVCQAWVQQASEQAAAADAELSAQENQLRQLQDRFDEFRQKLTQVPAIAIE